MNQKGGKNTMKQQKQGLEAVIDWVQVAFKSIDYVGIMRCILEFNPTFMKYEPYGRFRYAGKWCFGGIEILTPPADYPEMGYHIYMTGSACRSFEIYLKAQGRTWFDFFGACLKYSGKFTRLDLAMDDRKPYFAIDKLDSKVKKGECISKFRKRTFRESSTIKGEPTGRTLNLGANESKCFMVFYEKNYEQSGKTGAPVEVYGAWNRYEIRLRQELATECVRVMVERKEICTIALEIMNNYLRVLVRKQNDANRARWNTWKPWQAFINGMDKLNLTMRPAPLSLYKKKQWIADCVAPTLKMIQLADDNLDEAFLTEVIEQAELKPHQIKLVEDYLIGRAAMERGEQDETDK